MKIIIGCGYDKMKNTAVEANDELSRQWVGGL